MKTVKLVNKEHRESSVDSCQTDVNLNFRVHDIDNDPTHQQQPSKQTPQNITFMTLGQLLMLPMTLKVFIIRSKCYSLLTCLIFLASRFRLTQEWGCPVWSQYFHHICCSKHSWCYHVQTQFLTLTFLENICPGFFYELISTHYNQTLLIMKVISLTNKNQAQ